MQCYDKSGATCSSSSSHRNPNVVAMARPRGGVAVVAGCSPDHRVDPLVRTGQARMTSSRNNYDGGRACLSVSRRRLEDGHAHLTASGHDPTHRAGFVPPTDRGLGPPRWATNLELLLKPIILIHRSARGRISGPCDNAWKVSRWIGCALWPRRSSADRGGCTRQRFAPGAQSTAGSF